jgi:hypothetical protein
MLTFYRVVALATLSFYGASGLMGWELGASGKKQIPVSVRQSPGGNRSFHFWHSGFHGGK